MGVIGFYQSWSTALGTPAFAAPSNLTLFDVGTLTLSDVMQVSVHMVMSGQKNQHFSKLCNIIDS